MHCRAEVEVPGAYAHGDHIKCGGCGTKHKVARGDRLRLVLADVGPVQDALASNQQVVQRLEADLAQARASFGIGANGFGIGVIYAVYEVALRGAAIDSSLLWGAAASALVSGALLETANWAFLAKRHRIARVTGELQEARQEGNRLRALLRDAAKL